MKRKTLSLLIVIALLTVFLTTACGGGGENNVSGTQTAESVMDKVREISSKPKPTLDWGDCTSEEASLAAWRGENVFSVCKMSTPSP